MNRFSNIYIYRPNSNSFPPIFEPPPDVALYSQLSFFVLLCV